MYMKAKVYASREQGFSLAEVMIAMSILALGLLAAGQLLYIVEQSNSLARSKETAAFAAQNMMESLGALYNQNPSVTDLTLGAHEPRNVEVTNPADGAVLNRYQVSWTVENIPDPRPGKSLKARLIRTTVKPALDNSTENNQIGFNKTLSAATILVQRPQ